MRTLVRAGMRRLTCPGTLAVVALMVQAGTSLSQATTKVSGTLAKDTVVMRKRPTGVVVIQRWTPKIDSLVQALNALRLGSAEYARTQDSLEAALRAVIVTRPTRFESQDAEFTIRFAPVSAAAGGFMSGDPTPKGWMGMRADGINRKWTSPMGSFVHYLEYPTVVEVDPNSPAAKVGVRFGDTLVAYDGLDLRRTEINLTRLLEPGRRVAVRLRRDGEMNELTITVEKAPASVESERRADAVGEMLVPSRAPMMIVDSIERRLVEGRAIATASARGTPPVAARPRSGGVAGGVMAPTIAGVLGAAMTDVDADFAESIVGMKGKVGILVTSVPSRTLAERMGLKKGDVILRVENSDAPSMAYLRFRLQQMEMNGVERIRLTILRGGKTQELALDVR